jgi:solute:Na+ symporter, SSS family
MLAGLDIGILVAYMVIVLTLGLWAKRRASGSIEDYFLGGRHIPWYILGLSGMAAFLDMSGTMLQTSFFYMLGAKGYWIAWRGAVALMLAFFMIFMAKWLARSRVMTIAELIALRFGDDWQGKIARVLAAVSALIISVTMISYFFIGAGKFFHEYFPQFSPNSIAAFIFAIVMIYTVTSGFWGVVITDIFQGLLMVVVTAFITWQAMTVATPDYFAQFTTEEWRHLIPTAWTTEMPAGYASLEALGVLILFWLVLNVMQGFANPLDALSAQRFFAARSERDGALTAMQWIILMSVRFLLMMAMAVLAVSIAGQIIEPEMALPAVIQHFLPVGIKGLFIAALLAAFMSTVEALVNSSAAYFVRDIYQPFIRPDASQKRLVQISHRATIALFVIGGIGGLFGDSLNAIWSWLIMGFLTGLMAPSILKWIWWRFNAVGYITGMAAGIIGAGVQGIIFTAPPEYTTFLFVIACSTVGTIVGVYLADPTPTPVLREFYDRIRPFGWWGPIREPHGAERLREIDRENRRDLLLLIPACIAQLTLFWMMVAIVIKRWDSVAISALVIAVCSLVLYQYWYKNLRSSSDHAAARATL